MSYFYIHLNIIIRKFVFSRKFIRLQVSLRGTTGEIIFIIFDFIIPFAKGLFKVLLAIRKYESFVIGN